MGRSPLERAAKPVGCVLCALLACLSIAAPAGAVSAPPAKPIKIKPEALKLATATEPYAQKLSAGGGTAPYTFTLESGSLPEGIALSPSGELSGTPSTAGEYTFTVGASDSSAPANTASRTYTLTVQLDVGPKSIRKYRAFSFVHVPLTATGGSGPYEFSLASGELPEGVYLFGEELSGTPFFAGTYTFAIEATDKATGATGTREYKMKVGLGISPSSGASLVEGSVGKSYYQNISAEGGSNYSYALTEGELPEGLSLQPEENSTTIVGTPGKAGTSKFAITATDGNTGESITARYKLTISSIAFPKGSLELEESDKEGNFRGRDIVFFEVTREAKGVVHGTMEDGDGSTGVWSYQVATNALSFNWPETGGSGGFAYTGTCDQTAEECSGTQPFGTFVLRQIGTGAT
jgi:hypothetical protein